MREPSDFIDNFARQGEGRKNVSQKAKFFSERGWRRGEVTTRKDVELIVWISEPGMRACNPELTSYPKLWLWLDRPPDFQTQGIHVYQLWPEYKPKSLDIIETLTRIGASDIRFVIASS